MWSITHAPAKKKGSLRKDRNQYWYAGVFFNFHHILKLQSPC